jgi:hypothetical protein
LKTDHSQAVVKIMEGLAPRARSKVEQARRFGRVGMLFAAIKDADSEAGDEPGFRSRVEQILYLARAGDAEKHYSFGAIQTALAVRSWDIWEELWREKYPDRGDEWETGYDYHLMRTWRQQVVRLFDEHHQAAATRMSVKEYVSRLLESGLNEETAGELAAFFHKAFRQ